LHAIWADRVAVVCIGAFAVSWIAGFVFVLAPAGAGVREAIMVALLGTTMSPATALTVALISRFMLTLGDVILGGSLLPRLVGPA
jgi:uncharacterized membrane protein YbhN (UPF0104 family)